MTTTTHARSAGAAGPALRATALIVATTIVNVLAAAALVAALDVSDEFEALQVGPIASATLISMLVGLGVFLALRRSGPDTAERRFTMVVIAGCIVSMAGPLSLAGGDDASVPGWSAEAVWALVPLHVIPAAAALWLPRALRPRPA